eukprot:6200996-Pleurochrysis_carterae.AAC.1
MSTRCAAASSSSVRQLMARQSMPTAYATSGLGADETLIGRKECRVNGPVWFGAKRELDEFGQGLGSGRSRFAEEAGGGSVGGDVDVKEV